ncbi:2-polyprenyl-3-methyl-5-hydroxy-6-metoxy-1,4-benzoquinol methylase [Rhizobiales bacterium GAS188]|nr:2-polyprenyl-3-methyl-5-hydroxy-6-metoxy-1,4-benzoquinol methylase [Rhizobiales bacterium GAS188]
MSGSPRFMSYDEKRAKAQELASVQAGNKQWWTSQTMSYDWSDKFGHERFSKEWFEQADKRFIYGARLFAHDVSPFDRIIPFDKLRGKSILEIGCGMGLHTELLARAGARVEAIDLSPTSVEATRRRLQLKGLEANVQERDACATGFPDESFDFIWSWGVIHHSARTGMIIKEMHRLLVPGGEAIVMVYNLDGMPAYTTIVRDYLLGFWRGKTLDSCLWRRSDGYMARYYSADILMDIFNIFFSEVSAVTYGQDVDAVPLPRLLRKAVLRLFPGDRLRRAANRRGGFLCVTAVK